MTHRAFVEKTGDGTLHLETVQTPIPTVGQVLVEVLAAPVVSYARDVLNHDRNHGLIYPLTLGAGAIGRVEATGQDTTSLKKGQLVLCDPYIRARDDPSGSTSILQGWVGGATPSARILMEGSWRNGSWAEKMLVPTENVIPLDEEVLIKSLGYSYSELSWMTTLLVPLGGLLAAGSKAGDTVIVAPSTGHFGGAAVKMALALGARTVISAVRNEAALKTVAEAHKSEKVLPVLLSGNVERDAKALRDATPGGKGADIYIDLSPPQADNPTHPQSCIFALKHGAQAVLMGGVKSNITFNYGHLMFSNIMVRGQFMYGRDAPPLLVGLVEGGFLDLKGLDTKVFQFEQLESAIDYAAKNGGLGKVTTITTLPLDATV